MAIASIPVSKSISATAIWLIGVSFVLFQFFLQLSSGVVLGAIGHDIPLSALQAGIVSSAFYYIYTSLQIPVGMLLIAKTPASYSRLMFCYAQSDVFSLHKAIALLF